MPDRGVKLVLIKRIRVAGVVREPGYTLLEAVAPEATTRQEIERAIEEKAVKVYTFRDADGRPQVARSAAARAKRVAEETARKRLALEAAVKRDETAKADLSAAARAKAEKPAKKKGWVRGRK